ncbi:MAG TPA: endonuclease/exonuclease/phosphatase family protein [Pontiella sp.]|nr:endonuclease/exonuclease/phosphatase family protein [Pontiella sp.]
MKKKKQKRAGLAGIVDGITVGLAIATLFGFLGRFHWFLDLFSHFRVQYMQLCLVPFFIALWKHWNTRAAVLAIIACLNYSLVLPLYIGKPVPAAEKPFRAMLMNINAANGNTEMVLGSISRAEPDILLLEEVTPQWARALEILNAIYPYQVSEPQEGCFGIMLLSKYPLEHGKVVEIGSAEVPSITADMHLPAGVISVIGTHPVPPIGGKASGLRNGQLAELPAVIIGQQHPVLLIGDLNTSPWSSRFTNLLKASGLNNSMKGFGHQPSWPARHFFLRIPLDHVLHSPQIMVHNRMMLQDVGSDHFPVIVDFSLK